MNNPAQRRATKEDRQKQYSAMEIIDGQTGTKLGAHCFVVFATYFFPRSCRAITKR